MAKAAERARAQPVRLPALQHASLKAMGISLPWIVVDQPAVMDPPGESATTVKAPDTPRESVRPDVRTLVDQARQAASLSESEAPVVMPASPIIASLNLEELEQQISQCELCALSGHRQRRNAVTGQGDPGARLMIVGEAPGEQEDTHGLPFAGRPGELLDNMLAAIGHGRDGSVYLTNFVKCRPPAHRNPRPEEVASCRPYLMRQIELVSPVVVLAMGLRACQVLIPTATPESSLHQLREDQHVLQMGAGQVSVVATFHPAHLLRRPQDKRLAWDDLKRVAHLLKQSS